MTQEFNKRRHRDSPSFAPRTLQDDEALDYDCASTESQRETEPSSLQENSGIYNGSQTDDCDRYYWMATEESNGVFYYAAFSGNRYALSSHKGTYLVCAVRVARGFEDATENKKTSR
jgi:hypothetical protein